MSSFWRMSRKFAEMLKSEVIKISNVSYEFYWWLRQQQMFNIILKSWSGSMWFKLILLNSSLQNHIINLALLTLPYCYFHINDIWFRFLYIDGACIKSKHIWPKEVGLEKTGHFVFTYKFIKFSSSCLTLALVNSGVIVVCYCVLYLPKLTSLSIKFCSVVL